MTTSRIRRRAVALVLSLGPVLLLSSASPSASAVGEPTLVDSCPLVDDPVFAAADRRVEVDRITPAPSWRTDCTLLYRAESRPPEIVFERGFLPGATVDGEYDLKKYALADQASPYVLTSYDRDQYKRWRTSSFNYSIDAPGGIDVGRAVGAQGAGTGAGAGRQAIAFPGGISRELIVRVCPVDRVKKTEIMAECQDNPHYKPWRG